MDQSQLPADWQKLNTEEGRSLLIGLGCEVFRRESLLSDDEIRAADRENPDIMANVKAIREVAELVTWVIETDHREYYGYWRGPDNLPLSQAPIVQYDTEGQFNLCAGETLTASLAVEFSWDDEDEYQELKTEFAQLGIELPATLEDAEVWPEVEPEPNDLHRSRYEKYKGAEA